MHRPSWHAVGGLVGRLLATAPVLSLLWPALCCAGGILHVFPPTFETEAFAVARPNVVRSLNVITVSESSIEHQFDQTFFNDNDFPLQGIFILPVPGEGFSSTPEVRVNRMPASFDVVSAEDFFPTLRELAEGMKDPALLQLAGKNVLIVRTVNLGVRQQTSFLVKFNVPFQVRNDLAELSVPLDGERFSLGPVDSLEVLVRFKMSRPVRNLFSHTHHLSVVRESPQRCLVTVASEKKRVVQDFQLLTTFSGQDLDLKVLTHRNAGEKGTFMAMVAPALQPSAAVEPEKDVVFVLDASGGTGKANLALAKASVISCLEQLRGGDRFNVLIVHTRQKRLAGNLVPATADNVRDAVNFVNAASSEGGADLYNGLMNALEQFRGRKRSCIIVFAGHGRRTVGVTDPETIIEDVKRRNRVRARIFALALGVGADVALLDKLALGSKGSCLHLSSQEDFPAVMRKLFAGIAPPQIADLSLQFQDIAPEGLGPEPALDMIGPDGVLIFGSYDEKGNVRSRVRIKAKIKGRLRTQTTDVFFPATDERYPYVPALWAMRRVARLLERDWLKGPELQARQQIGVLAREFGFKNPFSGGAAGSVSSSASLQKDAGELLWLFKTSRVATDVQSGLYRTVGGKVFRSANGAWVDNRYRPATPSKTVRFLSEDYFSLLKQEPSIGAYLALGPQVTVVRGQEALIVTSDEGPAGTK